MKFALVDMNTQVLLKRRWNNFMELKDSIKNTTDQSVDSHGIYNSAQNQYTYLIVTIEEENEKE